MNARNRITFPALLSLFTGIRVLPVLPVLPVLSILFVLSVLTGCAGPSKESPISEWTFTQGEAFRAQRDAQRLNPAPADEDPVIGLDGRVGERVMKNMREGEKKPDEGNTLRFKIGK